MENSSSSRGKKRERDEEIGTAAEEIDQFPSLKENLTFSDNLAALRIMRAQFPLIDKLSSSRGKRQERDEEIGTAAEEIYQFPSFEENLTVSDTLVALWVMRAQFPHIDKITVLPFILRSESYSNITDRTQVDRELESLRREKVLRIFKLNTGQDDHAIMFVG